LVKRSEEKVLLKLMCFICGVTILETGYNTFSPLCCFLLCALLLTVVGLLCIVLLSCVYLCDLMCIVLLCVYCYLTYLSCPDCWLEVSIWKFLRPATSAQVFLGLPGSISECWDGSQDSKLLLQCFSCSPPDLNFFYSYVCYLYFIFMYMHNNHCHRVTAHLQSNILL